jgi:uncharacterized protein
VKYLLVIVVVGVVLWLMFGVRRRSDGVKRRGAGPARPVEMIACAHCGVHLPRADALPDARGRNYCGEAHRIAGPR